MRTLLSAKELRRWEKDGIAVIDLPVPLSEEQNKSLAGTVVAYRIRRVRDRISYDLVLAVAKDDYFEARVRLSELVAKRFPELTSHDFICTFINPPGTTYVAAITSP
ncbi:MAG: hypothetical protein KGI60_01790 [Patescibacteria group bacterium]|nr:hypothetical protein [Patescibacteria group bacterium]